MPYEHEEYRCPFHVCFYTLYSSLRQDMGEEMLSVAYYPLLEICVDVLRRYWWSLPRRAQCRCMIGPCSAEESDTATATRSRPPALQLCTAITKKGRGLGEIRNYILARAKLPPSEAGLYLLQTSLEQDD
jgi:hypothetical protein